MDGKDEDEVTKQAQLMEAKYKMKKKGAAKKDEKEVTF
jgi:hypothetical protein